jgi:ribonuclease HI
MEAMACREALALVQDLHLRRITVATDCLAVVNEMKRPFAGSYRMIIWGNKNHRRSFLGDVLLGMRIEHQILKLIDWHVQQLLLTLDVRVGL